MSAPARARTVSLDELLDWERSVPERHEYVGGVVRMMVGGTSDHATIALNIGTSLKSALRGGPCRVFVESMKVLTESTFTYPDVVATCSRVLRKADRVEEPNLIVEILSPTTEAIDRGVKWEAYRQIPSLQGYILVSQDHAIVELFVRSGNGWAPPIRIEGLEAAVGLPFLDLQLSLAEIYEGSGVM